MRDAFLDRGVLYAEWEDVALGSVAGLRASAGERAGDPVLDELIAELSGRSEDLRGMWARHDLRAKTRGMMRYRHPANGDLEYQTFTVSGTEGQVLHVFSAQPGSSAANGLRLLALANAASTDRLHAAR